MKKLLFMLPLALLTVKDVQAMDPGHEPAVADVAKEPTFKVEQGKPVDAEYPSEDKLRFRMAAEQLMKKKHDKCKELKCDKWRSYYYDVQTRAWQDAHWPNTSDNQKKQPVRPNGSDITEECDKRYNDAKLFKNFSNGGYPSEFASYQSCLNKVWPYFNFEERQEEAEKYCLAKTADETIKKAEVVWKKAQQEKQ